MDYYLPDLQIIESQADFDYFVWIPDKIYIILGRSDNLEQSVNINEAKKQNATIIKRPSGGHSVVLSPKTIVISMIFKYQKQKPAQIFEIANNLIIDALHNLDIKNLFQRGISDLCIGDKKILGSSMYKKPDKYFFHAVLNHSQDAELIDRLLLHPTTEPQYRKGRLHKDFVTSLLAENYNFTIFELYSSLNNTFSEHKINCLR